MKNDKLFVVVNGELAPGAQAAQAGHAISEFAVQFPDHHRAWHEHGKNLVILSIGNLHELHALLARARSVEGGAMIWIAEFHEPDFGNDLTAIVLIGEYADRFTSSLPLALKHTRIADPKAA